MEGVTTMNGRAGVWAAMLFGAGLGSAPLRAAEETGFQAEVRVQLETRLDWKFVAAGFGRDAAKLPADYDSSQQRYQLYVPKHYDTSKPWPLVLFVSPGDDPLGWRFWQKPCEDGEMFFCAAYGAGNNTPPGRRVRIVLDVLDDVRRHYKIDPDQTYVAGFSGGGRIACTIAFALPEHFGGVIPVCGTNPLNALDYLRLRVRDRLSVAFVTGATDFNRRENEEFMAPLFADLGIRSKLWVVPKLGHAVPGPAELKEVHAWLADDLERRRADAKAYPGLAASDDALTDLRRATRLLETAEAELKQPERTYRGVALLQGIVARWGKTEPGDKARQRLREVQEDARLLKLLGEQGGAEEQRTLTAQARALERYGERQAALGAWEMLAKDQAGTPEGEKAAAEAKRVRAALAKAPALGVSFEGETTTVKALVSRGPAEKAGLKPGDKVLRLGDDKTATLSELRKALEAHKPGDKVALEVERDGKMVALTVEVGSLLAAAKE
jgi:pimeloyl-ACP methyl ester carboxylesterase